MNASFRKLQSGEWGIKIEGGHDAVRPGDTVTVTKKNGETKEVLVAAVLYLDDECALCTIDDVKKVAAVENAPF